MSLPRFVQRLFANNGAGPKLRHDIIPWDEESRQAMIGTPMPMASTTLPPGFMWADGSFASFVAYPELKAKYDAGGFTGMLLAYNASEEDIAAYPGKFKPDAANPTGLFVPRLNGLFARYCGGTGAGEYHRDEIRNITGTHYDVYGVRQDISSGAFSANTPRAAAMQGNAVTNGAWNVSFDASRVVPTGPEVVPQHYRQPVALYLGRAAQV